MTQPAASPSGTPTDTGAVHECDGCRELHRACKAALLDRAERAERIYREHESEPGHFWKSRFDHLAAFYTRSQDNASRQALRADRAEAALLKATRQLARYEGQHPLPTLDDIRKGLTDA